MVTQISGRKLAGAPGSNDECPSLAMAGEGHFLLIRYPANVCSRSCSVIEVAKWEKRMGQRLDRARSGYRRVADVADHVGGVMAIGLFALIGIAVLGFVGVWVLSIVLGFDLFNGQSRSQPDGDVPRSLTPAEIVPPEPASGPLESAWSCHWDPTMNEDWHDDVLCMSGDQRDRPYLLPDWGFVTQADIMTEAQNYEDWLNSQIAPSEGEELLPGDVEGPTLEAFRQAVE